MLGGVAMVATLMTYELRAREKQLAEASIVDEKTGLYDRKYFLRSLSSEVLRAERDARPFSVLMLDIDDLARFNEVFGIARGDAMIRSVADTLASALEECCTAGSYETNVLSRFGGEEFAVLLVEGIAGGSPGPQDALAVGEVLRAAVESLRLEDASVTISVGVASIRRTGQRLTRFSPRPTRRCMPPRPAAVTASVSPGLRHDSRPCGRLQLEQESRSPS
jgi:diguanylate cyclase (GGDEF)-like protein